MVLHIYCHPNLKPSDFFSAYCQTREAQNLCVFRKLFSEEVRNLAISKTMRSVAPVLKTTDRGERNPVAAGREFAGTMDRLGEEAERANKDERALVFPWIGERAYPDCRVGKENLCDKP